MAKLKDRLKRLDKQIKKKWDQIDSETELTTRQKLEKLVEKNLKRQEPTAGASAQPQTARPAEPFVIREYVYPLESRYGPFQLKDW